MDRVTLVMTELNKRMPYMNFNWAEHGSRTSRLTIFERGVFDLVRTELWSVVGVKLSRDDLIKRLRMDEQSIKSMDDLIALGLLSVDADGNIFDQVQVFEFEKACAKGEKNKANAKKRWAMAALAVDLAEGVRA